MIGIMLAIFLSFSWFLLVWTNYSHWAFDKFINDKIPGAVKNRGIYSKTPEEEEAEFEGDEGVEETPETEGAVETEETEEVAAE